MIRLSHINKSYYLNHQTIPVLKDISLSIKKGEFIAITGASGSGKSTLMNIIGLLDTMDDGQYWLNDESIHDKPASKIDRLRNQSIGFVFQQFHLLPRLNAQENVALPLQYASIPKAQQHERIIKALEKVTMHQFKNHCPTELSGGQQQRVAIARALITEPPLILADEPTGALDSRTAQAILSLFSALHQEGRTIIIVTHDEHIAEQCERRIVLSDGRILKDTAL